MLPLPSDPSPVETKPPHANYRNKKTGRIYEVMGDARDCTNSRDGRTVVIYRDPFSSSPSCYVRDLSEFSEKFEMVSSPVEPT